MQYDAFISYRRSSSSETALMLKDRLKERGINCYLDLEEDKPGKFNKALFKAIENAPNFILLLKQNSLDRCTNKDDWVRQEIFKAMQLNKNIIPVKTSDFVWSKKWDNLPKQISKLKYHQQIPMIQEYMPAVIDKIITYMVDVQIQTHVSQITEELRYDQFILNAVDEEQEIEWIDMAFHSGSQWRLNTEYINLIEKIIQKNIKLRIIINSEKAISEISSHMRQPLKKYIGFDKGIENWLELEQDYPDNVFIKVANIPILHRLYIIRCKNNFGKVNVKSYTYGQEICTYNFSYTFTSQNPEYQLYTSEFDYLWKFLSSV